MYYLYTITPMLGVIKNYIKYKQLHFGTFIRTPLVYLLLELYIHKCKIWNHQFIIIVLERWIMFIGKSFRSYLRNDYQRNKLKYQDKYNLTY